MNTLSVARLLSAIFITVTLCPNIRLNVLPYADWYSLVLLAPIWLKTSERRFFRSHWLLVAFGACLILASTCSVFIAPDSTRGLVQTVKLGLIWLGLLPLAASNPRLCKDALLISRVLICLNAVCLLTPAFGIDNLAFLAAPERWETLLSPPSLASALAANTLVYTTACVLLGTQPALNGATWLAAVFVLIKTATRTSVVLGIGGIVLGALILVCADRTRRAIWVPKRVVTTGLVVSLLTGSLAFWSWHSGEGLLPDRIRALFEFSQDYVAILSETDKARVDMNNVAIEQIKQSPIVGNGLGASHVVVVTGEAMMVHNGFLQAWANMGIFGFVGYTGLLLVYMKDLPRVLKFAVALRDRSAVATVLQAAWSVICAGLIFFVNAFSTELSDLWLIVIQFGVFYWIAETVRSRSLERNAVKAGRTWDAAPLVPCGPAGYAKHGLTP